jgi:protein involved in polysaccharide export with SLBB domain
MSLEMQGRMACAATVFAAVSALGGGCTHRAPTNPAMIVALQPPAPAAPGPSYRIQIGDQLHVRFLYQPDMSEELPVRPDGRISLLATGELDVVGLTPTELERLIIERSSAHLRDPEVTVIVTKLGERRVYVGGEVARPGYVDLLPDMTPLQAVLQSGGFKTTAKLESVLLITPGPDGRFQAARLNMQQVLDGVPERVRLHTNDVVYVPRTWIADMDLTVDQYVRGLVPAFPRVGAGYSLSQ